MKFVTCNMLLGSEQVYVTIKLFNSYYSIFLTFTSSHSPIETLSNMLILATKNIVTKLYMKYIKNHVQASTSIDLKTAFFFFFVFFFNYKLTILSLKLIKMKSAISKC